MIRFPMHITRLIKKNIQVSKYLAQKLNREPTTEEIAKEMKIDRKTLDSVMMFNQDMSSIDAFYRDSENININQYIEDKKSPFPHQRAFRESLKETITEALKLLNEKERKIIILRFGLYGKEPKTLEDTGKELNITRERVRQIQIKALKKLSDIDLSKELENFLRD